MLTSNVPAARVRSINAASVEPDGDYVLYWMIAFRRANDNFSLQRAVEWAKQLKKPLVVLEALRSDYPWASQRLHRFIIEGMADNAEDFEKKPVLYYPYVEPDHGAGKGLLQSLASRACLVVSDDFPAFFLPRMVERAREQVGQRFELVDSNGLLPMRAAEKVYARAFDFRRFLQSELLPHLAETPVRDPLSRAKLKTLTSLPSQIQERWPRAQLTTLLKDGIKTLPVDQTVGAVDTVGGSGAASARLKRFLRSQLEKYGERNQPEEEATSGLSPYLHFGHISSHRIFDAVIRQTAWTPSCVAEKATGSAQGWWGMEPEVETFLDQLITWRELGYNMCWQRPDYDQYESLPAWAQQTLREHAADKRPHVYDWEQFNEATTHDALWNAAQRQLVREGHMHNYLRMLWGKKILEWSPTPRDALETMIDLNNRYALDGRNPNSYSGIFWILGRYDRAWGPERPIFGKIRYMSSDNTARKLKVKQYLRRYSAAGTLF